MTEWQWIEVILGAWVTACFAGSVWSAFAIKRFVAQFKVICQDIERHASQNASRLEAAQSAFPRAPTESPETDLWKPLASFSNPPGGEYRKLSRGETESLVQMIRKAARAGRVTVSEKFKLTEQDANDPDPETKH